MGYTVRIPNAPGVRLTARIRSGTRVHPPPLERGGGFLAAFGCLVSHGVCVTKRFKNLGYPRPLEKPPAYG